MKRSVFTAGFTTLVTLLAAAPALAVKPEEWKHDQPKDFLAGTLQNVVVSSLGDVSLGRDLKVLRKFGDEAEVVNSMARAADGKIYVATGPSGRIFCLDGEKVTELSQLPEGGTVLSLLFTREGHLLAGTGGGEQARIYRIDGTGKASVFYEPKGAKYIWAMARGQAGEVFAATGIEGQLWVIQPDGRDGKVLTKVKPKNLLCLAIGPNGMLYAGTDEDGLIFRINPADGKPFALYDAKEAEISAIVIDAEENIFASTASADAARPGRTVADRPGGAPEKTESPKAPPAETQPGSGQDSAGGDDEELPPWMQEGNGGADAGGAAKPATQPTATRKSVGHSISPAAPQGGNAIYRIDTNGFVTEVFREPVMILSMLENDGTIYIGTGNEGRIYSLVPAEETTTMLARLEAVQATSLLRLSDGQLVIGTANPASLTRMSERRAAKGTLTSKALDAGQVVRWGRIRWDATIPAGTRLTVATRSSNVEDLESNAWDEWSAEMDATSPQQVASPPARFLQYRISFETTVPDATPVIRSLTIPRSEENRQPELSSLEVLPAREEAQKPTASPVVKAAIGAAAFNPQAAAAATDDLYAIKWKAEDANKDTLVYEVYYRPLGTTRWIRIAKDLKEQVKIWDTRTVEDGKYQVRVVAKDSPSNPPGTDLSAARISDPVTVDNTPPAIKVVRVETKGKAVTLHAEISDALTPISEVAYVLDSDEDWTSLAADDDVLDSMTEAVSFTINDLEPGEHRIAIRARDGHGNARYVSRSVTIEGK